MSSFKSKDRKSLCEESMLVFVNILKFSSLSIARRTLVTSDDDETGDGNQSSPAPRKKNNNKGTTNKFRKSVPQRSGHYYVPVPESSRSGQGQKTTKRSSQRLEQPPDSNKSYVILPEKRDETTTVDGKVAEYIRRFHKKTENDIQNAIVESKAADYIKRFHEKNMKDMNNESMRKSHYVLPPPPHQVFK